jgi:phosphatidylserine/phosphatidylglycerophosphate/cardiolipin synthase-like enzyme
MPPSNCTVRWCQTSSQFSLNGGTILIPWTDALPTGCCCNVSLTCPGVPPPPPAGPHAVQLLRTYGVKRPPFPFAPAGERSIARAYAKAFARARSLIYIEDQYLWSTEVAATLADALKRNPDLKVIAVVPRYPDSDGPLAGPPSRIGQLRAIGLLRRVAPDRVGVFDLENSASTPIYVHAKICIIDDTWVTCGSANFNRRSWTTDSELICAVVDTTVGTRDSAGTETGHDAPRPLARDLRLQLWAEHLGLNENDPQLLDPAVGLELWNTTADAVDHWHETDRRARRPTAHVRHHTPEPVPLIHRFWARPTSRLVLDPDGRPRSLRGTSQF